MNFINPVYALSPQTLGPCPYTFLGITFHTPFSQIELIVFLLIPLFIVLVTSLGILYSVFILKRPIVMTKHREQLINRISIGYLIMVIFIVLIGRSGIISLNPPLCPL